LIRATSSAPLKHGSLQSETRANLLDIGPGVGTLLTVEGEVDDAEVNAQHILDADFLGVRYVANDGQEPLALDQLRST
jgi:predicted Zn-dependent protease